MTIVSILVCLMSLALGVYGAYGGGKAYGLCLVVALPLFGVAVFVLIMSILPSPPIWFQ